MSRTAIDTSSAKAGASSKALLSMQSSTFEITPLSGEGGSDRVLVGRYGVGG
jgi:hypothetical protein